MGSTRLPGKVLADVGGATMLASVVRRAGRAGSVDHVVVATSVLPGDDAVAHEAGDLGVSVFRGDELDVLDRFHGAARAADAELVVRVTADCPLIDPGLIDRVVRALLDATPSADFAANTLERTYPQGLDVEVAWFGTLDRAQREATRPYERAHVFPYIYEHPEFFRLVGVANDRDLSAMRWTVDTQEDLDFVRAVYQRLGNPTDATWQDVLDILAAEPDLAEINRHVRQKAVADG